MNKLTSGLVPPKFSNDGRIPTVSGELSAEPDSHNLADLAFRDAVRYLTDGIANDKRALTFIISLRWPDLPRTKITEVIEQTSATIEGQ